MRRKLVHIQELIIKLWYCCNWCMRICIWGEQIKGQFSWDILTFLKAGSAVSSSPLSPYAATSPFLFSKLTQLTHWNSTEVCFFFELTFCWFREVNYSSTGLLRTWEKEKGKGGCSSCKMLNWLSCLVKCHCQSLRFSSPPLLFRLKIDILISVVY